MSFIFKGGIPYGPDVKRLEEAFPLPELKEGRTIRHEEFEGVLEVNRHASRYGGVINSWLGRMKTENGVILVWQPGIGVKVLNPAEVLQHAEKRTRQKAQQLRRVVKLYAWVDRNRLDETGKRRLDHEMGIAARLAQVAQDSQKEMAIDLAPIKSMPKRIA